MRSALLFGLVALTFSTICAKERRSENKFRRYGPFPMKDKRGTDYVPGHISSGAPSGLFQPIMASIAGTSLTRALGGYQHGFDQASAGHGPSLSLLGSAGLGAGHGLNSMGISLGGHSGQAIYALPASSLMSASKTGPVMFTYQNGLGYGGSSYMKPIYSSGLQSLSTYASGSHGSSAPVEAASYGDLSTAGVHGITQHSSTAGGHGYNSPGSSAQAISGGLVFLENPHGSSSYSHLTPSTSSQASPSYHTGLSSGSSDSSSYQLPISSQSYPADVGAYSKYRQPPISSSGSSYAIANAANSLPSTSYGIPSNSIIASHSGAHSSAPTVHYSPPVSYMPFHSTYNTAASDDSGSSVNYASPSASYSQSEYPNHSQVSSYGHSEPQGSYSHISPVQSSHASVKGYNDEYSIPKYDTISYSSPSEKY
ncbi:probable ATP-dependent RNA helicase ddx17 [Diachasma alloeum]|uniref:probable ATP-dependent RNA helicase ddx17 n=1 Tax=Diachasma alloeum TaxID=454923 RepID=UPI0007383D34|nr:probable ATP-dependent RNA helicase ddx17 [Diachasma alloeum]